MKVYLESVGCRLNQSEIEKYAGQFRLAGHEIVAAASLADLVIVNTCAVTAEAASDSRQKIRHAARDGRAQIIVTGCWSTLDPASAQVMSSVQRVVANAEKDSLVAAVLGIPQAEFDLEPLARQPLPGAHKRTRAFIKAQDGCDNFCTFCITRLARGAGRSIPVEAVLKDIRAARTGGVNEVVLTGVHLGSWGKDLPQPRHLRYLIETLLTETDVPRLRLSSLEPWDLEADFFALWQDDRLCPHLHLPLQSGCAGVLRRMARKTTPQSYADLLSAARRFAPHIAITTDIIVGFPGETDAEFIESLDFVRQMDFANGHVFSYSSRPGTPAARLPGQVHGAISKQRGTQMRAVLAESTQRYAARFIGQTLPVLWESPQPVEPSSWKLEGLTGNYLRVVTVSDQKRWNQIDSVRLERVDGDVLQGSIISRT